MLVDIQMPMRHSKQRLFTLAPCLTAEEISRRDPKYFTPESIRYHDEFLTENEDGIAVLDRSLGCTYMTIDTDDAVKKYLPLVEQRNDSDPYQYEIALSVLRLILSNHIPINADEEQIKDLLAVASAEFWGKH